TANREEAGIVAIAFLEQDVERPHTARLDGKVGCAESQNGGAADVFEHRLGGAHIITKFLLAQRVHAAVPEAVGCDLMSGIVNAADDERVAIRDPAEREERADGIMACEQLEREIDGSLDAARIASPFTASNHAFERRDLEVFFDVDCKDMFHC